MSALSGAPYPAPVILSPVVAVVTQFKQHGVNRVSMSRSVERVGVRSAASRRASLLSRSQSSGPQTSANLSASSQAIRQSFRAAAASGSGGRGGNRRRCSSHRRRRFVPFMRFPLFVSFEFGKSQFNVQSSGRAKRPVE